MSQPKTRLAVLGSGAWGTTFAKVSADAGHEVILIGRDPAVVDEINTAHMNSKNLAGITLPAAVTATTDAQAGLTGADIVVVAVPSQTARKVLSAVRADVPADATIVSLMKGIELSTQQRMSQVIHEALELPEDQITVLSGPNLAKEIAEKQPTATVIAGTDEQHVQRVLQSCANDYFRPYSNHDVIGVELAGAVKNVIALAVGVAHGIGYGYNTTATLITRGVAELTRLGEALGADMLTFAGLAGIGDLVATCSSSASRNNTLGRYLGQGYGLDEATTKTGSTAEGATSCRSILALAQANGVEMPITQGVTALVSGKITVRDLGAQLLSRPYKKETA